MARIKEPQGVLPVVGFIHIPGFSLDFVRELSKTIGEVALRSHTTPFQHTTYYNKEMGSDLIRQWYAFDRLVAPDTLVALKRDTNKIEERFCDEKGDRKVNIDPGYISLSKLVLASTKNYSHRIYLGKGIYAEITLMYKDHRFNPLEWTYPDYRETLALDFFNQARALLKEKLSDPGNQVRE